MFQLSTTQLLNILTSTADVNNCLSNCSQNGLCSFLPIANKFVCECNLYFTDASCSTDIRPCSSNPCLNNGTCTQNLTDLSNPTYNCECGAFYYGSVCQYKIDVCQNETCSHNGNCIDLNNHPKCVCFSSFLGDECQTMSESLKSVKRVITTASVIAILTILTFYSIFILFDVHNLFIKRERVEKKKSIFVNINKIEFFK